VPRFAAVTIANITIKPSSVQIQAYLSRLGIRPINNVVDLTNLYMVITGQPLHAYDYDKVSQLTNGQGASLSVRYPKDGEKITLLGGKEVKPSSKTIMIATDSQAIGVGGVMGGSETEVDDQTKNIILECATFNMYSIRRTSMELGVFTEAVTRFTKGQSPRQNLAVLKKVSEEICQASGGNIASDVIDDNKDLPTPPTVKLSAGFINERLGSNYSPDDIAQVLMNVEFEVTIQNDDLIVVAPFWRTDIEIPEDIIEEVGRLRGFDSLPQSLPIRSIKPAAKDPLLSLKQEIRFQLSKLGANEVLTYSFVHGDLLDRMSQDKKNAFQITNALSPNLQYYRTSLLPSLLEKVHPNIKSGYDEFGLFELNPVHNKLAIEQSSQVPIEAQHLGFVFAANSKTAKSQYEGASYYQAKQYLSTLMFSLGVSAMVEGISDPNEIPPDLKDVVAPFEPSRLSGVILPSGDLIGFIGEFKPSVKKALKLPDFVCGFEIDLGKLIGASPSRPIYQKLSKYPFVEQDICFKVANNMSYQAIIDLVWNEFSNVEGGVVLRGITLVDIYQRPDDIDHKQVTIRISAINYERTMTDAEITLLLDQLSSVAKDKLNAERI
jgi:phenylalanyl-tRNA synthetase beta chain